VLAALAQTFVPPGSPRSRAVLDACHRAEALPNADPDKRAQLDRAVTAGEEAVAADETDALAHFALFCALGERLKFKGLSVGAVFGLRRARREIDRTLELAPDFSDAVYGKGALLMHTPRLLGGDATEAERLLRRTLELDPDYFDARLDLARALAARGARAEARAEAEQARALAERKGNFSDAIAARALLDQMRAD
jgi:tetratricopeptide (TPR) repeat protein